MFATMLRRDRERNGLRIARASWLVGVSVREYREIEAGTKVPDRDTYERVCELFGWPRCWPTDWNARSGGRGVYGLSPLARRFASKHGFTPTDTVSAFALDQPLQWRSEMTLAQRWLGPDTHIACAFQGAWKGSPMELFVVHEPGYGEDDPAYDYLCANTPLGVALGPTVIGRAWLVHKNVGLAGVEPLAIVVDNLRRPKGMAQIVALHRQIGLRTLDKSWEEALARSALIPWFTETNRA